MHDDCAGYRYNALLRTQLRSRARRNRNDLGCVREKYFMVTVFDRHSGHTVCFLHHDRLVVLRTERLDLFGGRIPSRRPRIQGGILPVRRDRLLY